MKYEPSRQIHLDFHTSEAIPGIGSAFDRRQFQNALQVGRVNQINIFAKCHHSWSYYPTKVGIPHPNLEINLLGEQIEVCHEIGVVAPIYYTGGWSAYDAESHPEWCMRQEDGRILQTQTDWKDDVPGETPRPYFTWKFLCPSGDYHELMAAQTEEICRDFPVDGMFYDIYMAQHPCYCDNCTKGMAAAGLSPEKRSDAIEWRARTLKKHMDELSSIIKARHPEASIYFNGITHIETFENFHYRFHEVNTKNDLEDLPTTWGGYNKFPLRSKIFHRENKPVVAMSGKFHTAWGEFGGFKNPEAIRYEAAHMIAFGASCNFGDHLHPSGLMDDTTYENIGHAFRYVEKIEEYGIGGLPVSALGVMPSHILEPDEGLVRMLLEEQYDFDVVEPGDNLDSFETIIVPSVPGIIEKSIDDLKQFMENGGRVIVLADGILNSDQDEALLECGAEYRGPSEDDLDYVQCGEALLNQNAVWEEISGTSGSTLQRPFRLPETPFLAEKSALNFNIPDEVHSPEILATVSSPFFNRTAAHYCGHQNTPNQLNGPEGPAAWRYGNLYMVSHPVDRMYYDLGCKSHRDYFISCLRMAHQLPMMEAGLPSAGRISLLHQKNDRRYVGHLLYGPPIQRGKCRVIEDLPELRDVPVRFRVPDKIKKIRIEPEGREIDFNSVESESGPTVIDAVIPSFSCHCALVLEY